MPKIATTIAVVLMLAFAAGAQAQDYRSPDARAVAVQQDLRSPDAHPVIAQPAATSAQDLRSPDAQPAGRFLPSVPSGNAGSSFDWGYLALGIAVALVLLGGLTLTQRRRRHGLAIGS